MPLTCKRRILRLALSIVLLLLICVAVWFAKGCPPHIPATATAVLRYSTNTEVTLTAEETRMVRQYLKQGHYSFDGAGCPFRDASISFGDAVYGISTDDCPTFQRMDNQKAYEMTEKGRNYIISLFEKYAGHFP